MTDMDNNMQLPKALIRVLSFYKISLFIFILSVFACTTAIATEHKPVLPAKAGPIPLVNQFPVQLLFLQPIPDRAVILPKGRGKIRLNTTLTNSLVSQQSNQYHVSVDMEALRSCLQVNQGISSWLELAYAIPLSYYWSGVLDGTIYGVEKIAEKTRGVREVEDRYTFTYHVKKNGKAVITGSDNRVGIGDIPIAFKAKLLNQKTFIPAVSARAAVKLPTGKKSSALGSGALDWGLGLLFEKDIRSCSLYLNGDVTFPGQAYEDEGVTLQEFYTLLVALEYRITASLSIIAQSYHITRPFSETGVPPLDRRIHEILAGFSYLTKNNVTVQGGIMEDIWDSADAGADITFFANFGIDF